MSHRVLCFSRYLPMGVVALVVLSALGWLAHGLIRTSDPLPSVEECDCVIGSSEGRSMRGRLDERGECRPIPCRICSDGRTEAPSRAVDTEKHQLSGSRVTDTIEAAVRSLPVSPESCARNPRKASVDVCAPQSGLVRLQRRNA